MYAEIFAVIAPTFICATIGYLWVRLEQPFDAALISRLVVMIGAPCLIVSTLSKVEVSVALLQSVLVAVLLVMAMTALVAALVCKLMGLPLRSFLTPLVFPNTANMGLPINLFAFGEQGLAIAIAIYTIIALTHFSLGVAVLSDRSWWRGALSSPIVYAALIAMGLIVTGWSLPEWVGNTVAILGGSAIPLMLLTLGASLSQLRVRHVAQSGALALVRIGVGVCVGWSVATLLELEGVMRGVVILQSSMPVAVLNYALAVRYQREPEQVAGMIVASTLLSFATLPVLLWFVM